VKNSGKTAEIVAPEHMRVCVVDDDAAVANLIRKVLSLAGFTNFEIFPNAEEFIVRNLAGGTHGPDLAVIDLLLPGINGFDLCHKVKEAHPDVPVLLISGYDIEDVQARLIESGADDFLGKPFSPQELVTRIKLHLAKYAARLTRSSTPAEHHASLRGEMPYIGDRIGRFVITDTLALGHSSLIYKVNCVSEKQIFCLKILARHAAEFTDVVARFQNEIAIMERLHHPHIRAFIDKGMHHGIPYLVMEYIEGVDLEELLIVRGKIPPRTCLFIAGGIASAIAELHAHHIIHRDIKLKNILYDTRTRGPKIIDFGIARRADSLQMTRDGFVVGTPIYMAPEIFEGESATEAADIYSFGATVYHLVTGSPPFVAETSQELYRQHHEEPPAPFRDFRSDIPEELDRIIVGECMAKRKENRPASMKSVVDRLVALIG